MTTGNEYLAAPTDFLAPFSLSIDVSGAKEFLLFKDLDFIQTYNPNSTTTGQPQYYAQFDVDNLCGWMRKKSGFVEGHVGNTEHE